MQTTALFLLSLMGLFLPGRANADTEFLSDRSFSYGMSQEDAAHLIYSDKSKKDWEIAYDIATESTWEIACRHHEEVMYIVRFYNGKCIFVEKRSELEHKDIEKTISKIFDVNGPTGEVAGNSKESQFFARWDKEERSIELLGMSRRGGKFLLSLEDSDEALNNEAMLVRDRELKLGRMTIDPITGKPRPHISTGEAQADEDDDKQPEPEPESK
jgi:hypothetical protein